LERTIRYSLERAEELSGTNKALGESRFNYRVLAENVPGISIFCGMKSAYNK
jgi:hypothetical protein